MVFRGDYLITDNFWREGGLQDISDDCAEIALQLLGEKDDGGQDNRYFRNGSRDLIEFCMQICVLVDGEAATLGDVLQMLNDRESLLRHALWAAGRLETSQ